MLAENEQIDLIKVRSASDAMNIGKRAQRDNSKKFTDENFTPVQGIWYFFLIGFLMKVLFQRYDPEEEHEGWLKAPDEWARLYSIVERAVLWETGLPLDPLGVLQGDVGTRYLLEAAASACLVMPEALKALFLKHDFALGVAFLCFWINCQWRVVYVDDLFPVRSSPTPHLCYAECKGKRQVWPAVLEVWLAVVAVSHFIRKLMLSCMATMNIFMEAIF